MQRLFKRPVKTIWFILSGILLLIVGVGGTFFSVADILRLSYDSFDELDTLSGDEGFAPFAVKMEEIGEEISAPVLLSTPFSLATQASSLSQGETPVPTGEASIRPLVEVTPTRIPVIPDRLLIPSIDLDAPIVPAKPKETRIGGDIYEQWVAPGKFAVGWHTTSAVLGQPGNTVLNGHHNVDGKVFENLDKVQPGDIITITGGSISYDYMIVNVMILPERNVDVQTRLENGRWIQPSSDERVTLVTCWPAWSNTHRLIVVAQALGGPTILPTPEGQFR